MQNWASDFSGKKTPKSPPYVGLIWEINLISPKIEFKIIVNIVKNNLDIIYYLKNSYY